MKPLVSIIMGSTSDLQTMNKARDMLDKFKVPYETKVMSAHRTPAETMKYTKSAARRGIKVIIAGAGGAAHLPGVIASHTNLPVIGVPIHTKVFQGLDSFLSIMQMPGGIPVATMSVGNAGATNAAIFAVEILALVKSTYKNRLEGHKKELVSKVKQSQKTLDAQDYREKRIRRKIVR